MGIKEIIEGKPTLEELQEREEREEYELSHAKREALIAELRARGRKWQQFSNNGTKSGISWERVKAFIRGD